MPCGCCERVKPTRARKSYEGMKRTDCFTVSELLLHTHSIYSSFIASKFENIRFAYMHFACISLFNSICLGNESKRCLFLKVLSSAN